VSDLKLPVTFEADVTSSNRVTIPTWLSFIEQGDSLEGYLQLIDKEDKYPFDKTVSSTRHITVGFLKPYLQSRELPSRLRITIEKVHKQPTEGLDFNLVGYKEENGTYTMIHPVKPDLTSQFQLDTLADDFAKNFFEDKTSALKKLDEVFYIEEAKKWIKPVVLLLSDEMGAKVPVILFLVLSQDYYQKLSIKIEVLLKRFISWIFDINDFNISTLSKLSSQLQMILENDTEPEYLDMKEIFDLPSPQRDIALIVIKEHRHRGIILEKLLAKIKDTKQNVEKAIDELVKRGIIRTFEENNAIVIDSLWST